MTNSYEGVKYFIKSVTCGNKGVPFLQVELRQLIYDFVYPYPFINCRVKCYNKDNEVEYVIIQLNFYKKISNE
jgi:hypothetical protein